MDKNSLNLHEVLQEIEQKRSRECPVDINKVTFSYIKTMLVVPAFLTFLIAIIWCFTSISWIYFGIIILSLTIIQIMTYAKPVVWRFMMADFPNSNQAQCLYELAKWKEHNPLKYMPLLLSDEVSRGLPPVIIEEWEFIANGDMMLKAAQLKHPEAQFEIGMRKYSGEYPNINNSPLELVISAACLGSVNAQAKLGSWYLNGYRVDKNLDEALKWLQKSAAQFNHEAECDLGEMYFHGNGVVKDKDKGLKLLKRAADGGLVFAQHKLGCILYREAKNYNEQLKGIKYILDASNYGHVDSKIFLSILAITTKINITPLVGYATLIYLGRTNEVARKAVVDFSNEFTESEKAEANKMAMELNIQKN